MREEIRVFCLQCDERKWLLSTGVWFLFRFSSFLMRSCQNAQHTFVLTPSRERNCSYVFMISESLNVNDMLIKTQHTHKLCSHKCQKQNRFTWLMLFYNPHWSFKLNFLSMRRLLKQAISSTHACT